MIMGPLAEIVDIYHNPLTENSDIRVNYAEQPDALKRVAGIKQNFDVLIDKKRDELGILGIRPINLSAEQAEKLRQAIKSDRQWVEGFQEIVSILDPDVSSLELEDQLTAVQIPWWNSNLLFRTGDVYDSAKNSLEIGATLAHSYVVQLMRAKKTAKTKKDAMIMMNVLMTSDGLLVLGWRGGHTYSDTLNNIPAGSVEYHSGKNPLFETLYAEFFEEAGLTKKEMSSAQLVGRAFDHTLTQSSAYIFRSRTKLSFSELLSHWSSSIDQKEHKYLIPFLDDPQIILAALMRNAYDPSKENPDRTPVTTMGNVGSILPPCGASLLLHYAQREGIAWGLKAEKILNRMYRFKLANR